MSHLLKPPPYCQAPHVNMMLLHCSHKPLCILVGVHSVGVGMREQGAVGPGHARTILMAQRLYPWPAQCRLWGQGWALHLIQCGGCLLGQGPPPNIVQNFTLCREMRVSRLVDDGGEAGRVAQEVLVQALLLLHCDGRKCKYLLHPSFCFLGNISTANSFWGKKFWQLSLETWSREGR